MKAIIVFILIFLIFYFIWQFIKRMVFIKIFKKMNTFSQNNPYQGEEFQSSESKKENRKFKKNIKWDAETIDYEEVPNSKR